MSGSDTRLAQRLKAKIRTEGPITFRDFMAAALYDPDDGFYAKGPQVGSVTGPYLTNAMFPAFGFALARAILRADELVGEPLRVVEFGGGTGRLASTIQSWLPAPREYRIVEPSPGLRALQRARGLQSIESPYALDPAPTIVLANEVLDALPVHRVMGVGHGRLCELYVGLDERGHFMDWPDRPSTPELIARLEEESVTLGSGQVAEVCLELHPFLESVARIVSKGYIVFIDYGDEARQLYGPARRNGTLRAYWNRQEVSEWYVRVGDQDLTADVDYTALSDAARRAGLQQVGRICQGLWLRRLGIDDYVTSESPVAHSPNEIEKTDEIVQLVHPARLGTAFDVLVFKTPGVPDGLCLHFE